MSLCSTAIKGPFIRSVCKHSLVGMIIAVANERPIKVFFANLAIEKLSKSKHLKVNLFPREF